MGVNMREYWIWRSMIRRCADPTRPDYSRYGGAGVTVCDEWRFGRDGIGAFRIFMADVGPRPSRGHSLDRIDNAKGYMPGNVRWATAVEQANNKSNNHLVTYRNETMTIASAVRAAGDVVTRENARCRINNGWPVASAVETPPLFRREKGTRKVLRQ